MTKLKAASAAIALTVLAAFALTGCGEVNMYSGCTPNPAGGYDFYFIVANNVAPYDATDQVVTASGLQTAPTAGNSTQPLLGQTITAGNSAGFFLNAQPYSTQTFVVETTPVGSSTGYANYITKSC